MKDKYFCSRNIQFDSEGEFKKLGNLGFAFVIKEEICPEDTGFDVLRIKYTSQNYKMIKTKQGVYTGTVQGKSCEAHILFKLTNDRYESTNLVALFLE
jgi:hypothetical protein